MIYYFWINLDCATERRKAMLNKLESAGITATRISACEPGESWVIEKYGTIDAITACALSHLYAVKTAYSTMNPDDIAVIFEDDVSFDFLQYQDVTLEKILLESTVDWDVLQLAPTTTETCFRIKMLSPTVYLKHNENYWGAAAYAIKYKHAAMLIGKYWANEKWSVTSNKFISEKILFQGSAYTHRDSPLTYDIGYSYIHNDHNADNYKSKMRYELMWKIKHCGDKCIQNITPREEKVAPELSYFVSCLSEPDYQCFMALYNTLNAGGTWINAQFQCTRDINSIINRKGVSCYICLDGIYLSFIATTDNNVFVNEIIKFILEHGTVDIPLAVKCLSTYMDIRTLVVLPAKYFRKTDTPPVTAEPPQYSITSYPKVSALCITKNSWSMLLRSINLFLEQDYPNKELIIIYDNKSVSIDKLLEFPFTKNIKIIYSCLPTLGELRNYSIQQADGEYCIQWDDDDIYSPERISVMVRNAFQGISNNPYDTVILENVYKYNSISNKLTESIDSYAYGFEGSVIFRKESVNDSHCYSDKRRMEDTDFMITSRSIRTLKRPDLYLYIFHGENVWKDRIDIFDEGVNRKCGIIHGLLERYKSAYELAKFLRTHNYTPCRR